MSIKSQIEYLFPKLQNSEFRITSPEDESYNCIAWATHITHIKWWPCTWAGYYWPSDIPIEDSVETFIVTYESLGFKVCDNHEFEDGFEKIAIFEQGSRTKHAARQLESGLWTSKLGDSFDIEHKLFDLTGKQYGKIAAILKRPKNNN